MNGDFRSPYVGRQPPFPYSVVTIRKKKSYRKETEYEDGGSLSHFGILGQKWGVRRYQNEDGTLTEAGKKRYGSDSAPESETWKKSDAEHLSDEELNRRNSRLQRERQYKDLTTKEIDREREQFKKDIIKKALILPIVGLAALAGKKYIGKASDFLTKTAKKKVAPYKAAAALKNFLKNNPNVPDQAAPVKEILGKHVYRMG